MAETILLTMVNDLLNMLCSSTIQEIGLLWGLEDELLKLRKSFSTIKAVLLDAEKRKETSHEVEDWLRRLKTAFYHIDDLLDDISAEVLRRKVITQDKKAKKVRLFFSRSNQLAFSLRIVHEIKAIRENLDTIAEDRNKFHFTEQSVGIQISRNRQREETHSFIDPEEAIGRENDKMAIVRLLLDSSVEENVSVLPIVGIGGLGKTTIAKLVYNDGQVKGHFELRIWVCVSDVFDVKLIAEKIVESVTKRKMENLQMDQVQEHLRREIDGKKYILVLDDVWNENREKWLKLRDLLAGGAWGSRILLTTRSGVVAAITGTIPTYILQGLPEEISWLLFLKMAFRPGEDMKPGLIEIGKEIVRKCVGVPLAIRALASFLYYKDTESEWLFVKNNQLSEMADSENIEILPILKLSYDSLPSHLKQCFAYCALFEKDQVIDKQTLVQLWMAQGFIKSMDHQNQDQEQVGDQYFLDLVRRSFFQDIKQDKWGNVRSCKIHDLIHDLAQSVADCEGSATSLMAKNGTESILHISLNSALDSSDEFPDQLLKAKALRTILLPIGPWNSLELGKLKVDMIISSSRRLRVLDLHGLGIIKLPNSIGKLRNLRYLDLSENSFETLPRSIAQLVNLQTLKLSYCYDLEELPINIHNMVSLRHLELEDCSNLTRMPCGLGKLTSLRKLSQFVVSQECSLSRVSGGIDELKGLIHLQGELRIRNLGSLQYSSTEEETEKILKNKGGLQSLRLEWGEEDNGAKYAEQLMEALQPHPSLNRLFIEKYRGFNLPTWMMNHANLTKITLRNCNRCKHFPPFGQLPSLQHLKLENLASLEYTQINQYHNQLQQMGGKTELAAFFPSLLEIKLDDLPCLKGWWKEEAAAATVETASCQHQDHIMGLEPSFPLLSKLTIKDCPNLVIMPHFPCLEELKLIGVNAKLMEQQMGILMKKAKSSASSSPLGKLKSLYIVDVENLVSLPEGLKNFSPLEQLEISYCPRLLRIPEVAIRASTMLRFLKIHDCGLTSLFQGIHHLNALETLWISKCKNLDLSSVSSNENEEQVQLEAPRRLRALYLEELPQLVNLPNWLQNFTSLQFLSIEKCYNLIALPEWISKFNSLQTFYIYKCYRLESIPEEISCLAALQELRILMCPKLYKRCREGGEDRPKINHISRVTVG